MSKQFKTQYKTLDAIMKRISEMTEFECKRDFTKKEETEYKELKKLRNKMNPEWYLLKNA